MAFGSITRQNAISHDVETMLLSMLYGTKPLNKHAVTLRYVDTLRTRYARQIGVVRLMSAVLVVTTPG